MGYTVIQIPVQSFQSTARYLGLSLEGPHITLLGSFVDRWDVDDRMVRTIDEVLTPVRPFGFQLTAVGRFESGIAYLMPKPSDPFIRLANLFTSTFPQWPPYGGAFKATVPHLTIGQSLTENDITGLTNLLPLSATADEVTLTWWSKDLVEVLERFPLRSKQKPNDD